MGYTRYWDGRPTLNDGVVSDVRAIIARAGVEGVSIRDGAGDGEPEVSTERIWINGDRSRREDYETLLLDPANYDRMLLNPDAGRPFGFCKTARKPYDYVVAAVLLRVAEEGGGFTVSTDGPLEDWADGTRLYKDALHREPMIPEYLKNHE